jgi:AraC-like DNA-binding protein/mannose-6-phosphate isomerase-like protein (cupin superfamily)
MMSDMTGSARSPVPERAPAAERSFTTVGLDRGDQWDYWNAVTRTAFVAMIAGEVPAKAPGVRRAGFDASSVARETGGLRLSTMSADPHEAARTPELVRRTEGEDFFLTLIREGAGAMRQDDRSCTLGPGDFTLVDSARPYVFRSEERFRSIVLQIPRGMLTSRCAAAERITAVPFRATGGPGALFSPVLRALADEARALDTGLAHSITANVLDLLATVCSAHGHSAEPASPAAHRRDLERAKECMDERLHDPGLTLLAVGQALGFSLRYLHQLFQEAGSTPRTWLYDRRLDRARAMLMRRPDQGSPTIADVALRVGFKDSSHFSRAFKARYGASPANYRTS